MKIAFIFLFLTLILAAEAADKKEVDELWWTQVNGSYSGYLNENLTPVITEFLLVNDSLVGEYLMDEDGEMVPGLLDSMIIINENTIEFTWFDKYGEGSAVFCFQEDCYRFEGYWTSAGSSVQASWWGQKTRTSFDTSRQ